MILAEVVCELPLLLEIASCCEQLNVEGRRLECAALRLGGLIRSMTVEDLEPWGGSRRKFMEDYVGPRIGRKVGMLYIYTSVSERGFTEPEVERLGLMGAYEVGKAEREPGLGRQRLIEAIPEGSSKADIQQIIAGRNGLPIAAVQRTAFSFTCTVEESDQITEDVEALRKQEPGITTAQAILMAFAAMSA